MHKEAQINKSPYCHIMECTTQYKNMPIGFQMLQIRFGL